MGSVEEPGEGPRGPRCNVDVGGEGHRTLLDLLGDLEAGVHEAHISDRRGSAGRVPVDVPGAAEPPQLEQAADRASRPVDPTAGGVEEKQLVPDILGDRLWVEDDGALEPE